MKTGKIPNVGVGQMDGVQMSNSEYESKLIAKGYTIERTPNGKIISPPKK